jgi:DNA (cytosine-5)-methyltransferase 1
VRQRRALFLFGGEGGDAAGWHRAGWDVTCVDNDPARLAANPFRTVLADALEYGAEHASEYDAVAASPTCTGYSRGTSAIPDRLQRYPRLIGVTREILIESGRPFVIENVRDAKPELRDPIMLCGRMFGLGATDDDGTPLILDRHRLFEAGNGLVITAPPHPVHRRNGQQVAGVYSGARRDKMEARLIRKGGYVPPNVDVLRELIGAPWMTERGLFHALPPVYGEHIARQVTAYLDAS